MFSREFFYWCRDAVSQIKYGPDRKTVYLELYEHMEDRYHSFVERGMTHETAEKKTLEAMGDPKELAPQLAAIHKPHWAYAMLVTRSIVVALIVHCIIRGIIFLLGLGLSSYPYDQWDPYTQGGDVRIAYMQPDVSDTSDGYTFTVEEAALWRTYFDEPTDAMEYFDDLYLRLSVTNPLPWMPEQEAVEWMWAVDSEGIRYNSHSQTYDPDIPWISFNQYRTGIFTYAYELAIQDTTEDIQWIELHYDRAGRDVVLRVDLTGGRS